nr:MAG TPA: hypothetical protein [Caudoviricetes sp.]
MISIAGKIRVIIIYSMKNYIDILEKRVEMEDIELPKT